MQSMSNICTRLAKCSNTASSPQQLICFTTASCLYCSQRPCCAGDVAELGLCAEEESGRHLHGACRREHCTFRCLPRLCLICCSHIVEQASTRERKQHFLRQSMNISSGQFHACLFCMWLRGAKQKKKKKNYQRPCRDQANLR